MPDAMDPEAGEPGDDAAAAEKFGPALFGSALPQAQKYAQLLIGTGVERGVVGPAEADRIWERHLLNCGAVARLVPTKCFLVDLGSGAGLPGIVLAILLPGVRVTLLEPMARRVDFLAECVADLGLGNAEVVRGRAEDLAGQLSADVVTARAVAPLEKLAGISLGLLRPGGKVLAMKGSSAESELARARPVLARLGVTDARVVQAGGASGGPAATVVTFSAPGHRSSGYDAGPMAVRTEGRAPGRPVAGRVGYPGSSAGGRKARPNSRRGGG
jgi:16S rRNA (guanine527-N7)-methyltransferase